MAAPTEPMLEHDELGPLYEYGSLYEEDAHETVTYRYAYGDSVAVQLTVAQEQQGDVQSGFCVSPAAQALCEYLAKHRDEIPNGTIVELGAGCGLAGLAIAQLRPDATVVFTDHDPGVLKTVEYNCTQQERKHATCLTKRVRWGSDGADEIAALESDLQGLSPARACVDMIVGSDIIYARGVVAPLFWTVDRLLKRDARGVFLMCSSYRYDDATEREIDAQCARFGLAREILHCGLGESSNGSRVQRFTRTIAQQ